MTLPNKAIHKTILVKSDSSDEPYGVIVSSEEEKGLSIVCDCRGGMNRKICKHKAAIVLGDTTILYDEEQINTFNEVSKWIAKSRYPKMVIELKEAEKELEKLTKTVKSMKANIAKLMSRGLK